LVPSSAASVPEVGRVTFVDPVVARVSAFDAVNVITSPPPKVIEFVLRVAESLKVKVFPVVPAKVKFSLTVRVLLAAILRMFPPLFVTVRPETVLALKAYGTEAN
jgi:hypothetical protein